MGCQRFHAEPPLESLPLPEAGAQAAKEPQDMRKVLRRAVAPLVHCHILLSSGLTWGRHWHHLRLDAAAVSTAAVQREVRCASNFPAHGFAAHSFAADESRRMEYCGWQKSCTTRGTTHRCTPLPPVLILGLASCQLVKVPNGQNPAPRGVSPTTWPKASQEQQY